MKRLAIALSTIGLSSTIFAALPATTDPTLVAVPQLPGGFVIGGTAYYLEPSFTHSDLDFASISNFATTTPFATRVRALEPNYDWGWGVNLGYIFPNTGNDINLSYFHFEADDRDSIIGPNISPIGNLIVTSDLVALPPFSVLYSNAQATVDYDLNRVDLTTGQYIDVGCRLILHPSVGVSYFSFDRDLDSVYAGNATGTFDIEILETLTDFTFIHEKSDFDGVGPIAAVDASYYLGLGFGLVGHADAGLYIGDMDVKTDAVRNVFDDIFLGPTLSFSAVINNDLSAKSNRHVVPVTDIKLGADYTYLFNNAGNSDLTLEVGWMVSHYFNAVERLNSSLSGAIVNGTGTGFIITNPFVLGHTTSDFGLSGPYVNLTLHV